MAASSLCRTVAHSLLRCRCSGPFAAAAATAVTAPASARLLAASSLRHVPVRQASTSSSAQHPAAAHFQRKKGRQGRRGINDKTAGLGALAGTLLSLSLMGLFGQEESGSQATSSIESINYLPQISTELLPYFFAILLAARDGDDNGTAGGSASTSSAPPFTVRSVPNKGLGAFADRPIQRGEVLIAERPLLVWPTKLSLEEAQRSIAALTPNARNLYLSLANAAEPSMRMDPIMAIRATNGFTVELPPLPDSLEPAEASALPAGEAPTSASFIFPKIARINHSCAPNADHAMDWQDLKMTVYATTPIVKGDEINIEYTSALIQKPRAARREILKRDFGFTCHCRVCALPEQESLASDSRRREIDAIVELLGEGPAAAGLDRKMVAKAFERLEGLLLTEGYNAMPEFSNQRVSDAYVGFRSMRMQQS